MTLSTNSTPLKQEKTSSNFSETVQGLRQVKGIAFSAMFEFVFQQTTPAATNLLTTYEFSVASDLLNFVMFYGRLKCFGMALHLPI